MHRALQGRRWRIALSAGVAVLIVSFAWTMNSVYGSNCVTCATGCAETTWADDYNDLTCSCPTGGHCVGVGVCTTCTYAGQAFCWDYPNDCGGVL